MSLEIELAKLVETDRYQEAEALCLSHLSKEPESLFWQNELGYVYFLDEKNHTSYYIKAPETFEHLATKYPSNANVRFWLGYLYSILWGKNDIARNHFESAMRLNETHPYANIGLAGICIAIGENEAAIKSLQRTLQQQPTNFHALQMLADVMLAQGQPREAVRLLHIIVDESPYVETEYGIMNVYINDVLTGASRATKRKEEALKIIQEYE